MVGLLLLAATPTTKKASWRKKRLGAQKEGKGLRVQNCRGNESTRAVWFADGKSDATCQGAPPAGPANTNG